jgi:hypothetical protein
MLLPPGSDRSTPAQHSVVLPAAAAAPPPAAALPSPAPPTAACRAPCHKNHPQHRHTRTSLPLPVAFLDYPDQLA